MASRTSPPSPPRLTGDYKVDAIILREWMWAFFTSSVVESGLLDPVFQSNAGTFDPTKLPDPTATSIAKAQDTANHAYKAVIAQAGVGVGAQLAKLNLFPQLYCGCNAGSFDGTRMYFNPGTLANFSGSLIFSFSSPIAIDVTTTGINPNGTPPDPTFSSIVGGMAEGGPPANLAGLNFYACTRDTDGAVGIVASTFTTYGDVAPYIPAGWTLQRKMRFCCTYATGRGVNWTGLPNFFTDIDGTRTVLTGSGLDANYQILSAGTSTIAALASAATFVPDPARWIRVYAVSHSNNGAGKCHLQSAGGASFPCGELEATGNSAYGEFDLKLDSSRNFTYHVDANMQLDVYIKEYRHDEPD